MQEVPRKKSGPVPKPINWTLFEELCGIQCTQTEIASMLKIHIDTLRDRCKLHYEDEYSNVYRKFSEVGKCSLRRYQFVQARTKPNMAIWLGKQWLGQKDHEERTVAPNEDSLNLRQQLYAALYQLAQIKKEFDDFKSKASPELQRSDSSVQPVDRVSELGQNVREPG